VRQVERPHSVWCIASWYGWRHRPELLEDCCGLAEPRRDTEEQVNLAIANGGIVSVTREEFDWAWESALASRRAEWEELKRRLPIGRVSDARSLIFYPHGVVMQLGEPFVGLLPLEAYRAHFAEQLQREPLSVHWSLAAAVEAFDDHYQWVLLRPA
jgi:hypothetical protein